ncbi:hypothetical protein V6Z11_D01G191700, partial [Gossypium hirsutum]
RFKLSSSVTPVLSPSLSQSESISTIVVSQANFKRIIIPPCSSPIDGKDSDVELLCMVGDILKKIKKEGFGRGLVVMGSIKLSSEILDPPVANVDHVLLLFTMEQPTIGPFMLTRFLVEAESTDLPLTFAFNKTKLVDEEGRILMSQTIIVLDTSGVAKSSLINVLRSNHPSSDALEKDNWFENRRVGKVSTRGRGKHTTRHVSLLSLSGVSYLADTPRFNRPNLLKVTRQSLAQAFPNAKRQRPMKCSFNNCLHIGEPGCIVKGNWERNSYHFQFLGDQNQRGISIEDIWDQKREYTVGDMGVQRAEPQLEPKKPKKHRRQSRKKINQSIVDELNDDDNLHLEIDPIVRATKNENQ